MASPILHIKDSYYFEVPKSVWPVRFGSKADFTGAYETWLRLDPDFQLWEANRFYDKFAAMKADPPGQAELIDAYVGWKEVHANAGKPIWRYIAESHDKDWYTQQKTSSAFQKQWQQAIEETSGPRALAEYRDSQSIQWGRTKLDAYNNHLSGKILIPQPFGRLRNLYEKEWGVCISRFMIVEVLVLLVLWGLFSWLARNVGTGDRPRGALWNLLEAFVLFVRDEIARPVIGHEAPAVVSAHAGEGHGGDGHADSAHAAGHGHGSEHVAAALDHGHGGKGPHSNEHGHGDEHKHGDEHGHHHDPQFDADRFVPLLLTIFFFVLGCNLSGMIPYLGSPTGVWGTTSAIAIVTFATGLIFGIRRFGLIGYFVNQIPGMEVPWYAAIILKPMIFAIEILGLLIKHAVLSIRLLANMLAGHMVLVSIMALAFSVAGAYTLDGLPNPSWNIAAPVSIVGCTLLSCLELFVAFLQAYIFTFLSAMFIGGAIHHH